MYLLNMSFNPRANIDALTYSKKEVVNEFKSNSLNEFANMIFDLSYSIIVINHFWIHSPELNIVLFMLMMISIVFS